MTNEDRIIGWEITTNENGVEMATLPAERLRQLVARDAARLDERESRVKELVEFANDISTNYDHDFDAHNYGNEESQCRVCKANRLIQKHKQ